MIKVQDWIASIPEEEKHIAYVGEGMSEQREFLLCGEGWEKYKNWGFHLDMAFDPTSITTRDCRQVVQTTVNSAEHKEETGATKDEVTTKETYTVCDEEVLAYDLTDVASLDKWVEEGGIRLTWTVLRQHTLLPGKLRATIRAVGEDPQKIKKSAIMVFEVEPSVEATPAAMPSVSQFEQMEAEMDALRQLGVEAAETAASAAQGAVQAQQAVTDAAEAAASAAQGAVQAQQTATDAAESAMVSSVSATSAAQGAVQAQQTAADAAESAMISSVSATSAQQGAIQAQQAAAQHAAQAEEHRATASEAANAAVSACADAKRQAQAAEASRVAAAGAASKCSEYVLRAEESADTATKAKEELTAAVTAVEELDTAVFLEREVDVSPNLFNPNAVTIEPYSAYGDFYFSEPIPCKTGDVLHIKRRIADGGVEWDVGWLFEQHGPDGGIAYTGGGNFVGYDVIEEHVNLPNGTSWVRLFKEVSLIDGYENGLNDLMLTVNEEYAEFIPYYESTTEKVSRIEENANEIELLKEQMETAEKNWLGKKVLVMGDSISTDYYGDYTKWVTVLKNQGYFPADTTNDSIHATGFVAKYNNEPNDFLTRIEAVENKETYDLVVIFGGINDFLSGNGIPLGESGGDKTAYFKPAVDYFFDYLVNHFTQARIVVLSPLRTHRIYPNVTGHEYTDYIDYIKEVAQYYCLPVLNLTEESGFCPHITAFSNKWTFTGYSGGDGVTGDGVHPNAAYEEKHLAPMIKSFLDRFL